MEVRNKFELAIDWLVKQKLRKILPAYNEMSMKKADRLMKAGVITRSKSSWSTSVLIVMSESRNTNFCVDYRRLSAVMKRDRSVMPRVDEIFNETNSIKPESSYNLTNLV